MTTYRAVVKYEAKATDREKLRALRDGLSEIVVEMLELGLTLDQVEDALDDARSAAEDEANVLADLDRERAD